MSILENLEFTYLVYNQWMYFICLKFRLFNLFDLNISCSDFHYIVNFLIPTLFNLIGYEINWKSALSKILHTLLFHYEAVTLEVEYALYMYNVMLSSSLETFLYY